MRGEFDRLIAVGGEAVEELQQLLELVARKCSEQCVVDRALECGESRQSFDARRRHRELHTTAIAGVRGFFDQSIGHQLVHLDGNESAAEIQALGELIDSQWFILPGMHDGDQDQILRRRQVGITREFGPRGVETAPERKVSIEKLPERLIAAVVQEFGA